MKLNDLRDKDGATKSRKRVGAASARASARPVAAA